MSNDKPQLNITLTNVRLSFPALFDPSSLKQADGSTSKPKFQATFLLDKKEHAKAIAEIKKLSDRAQIDKFGKVLPKLKNFCLKDGSEKEDTAGYSEDVMSVIAKSDQRPVVVDQKKVPLTKDDGKPYGGCYVNAGISIFAYKHAVGGNGVSAGLRWVQFAKDGEAFGGGRVDMDEIPEVEDTAGGLD